MNERNISARNSFSRIGAVYAVFSIVVTIMQVIVLGIMNVISPEFSSSMEAQMICSTAMLYVLGLIVLTIGLKSPILTVTPLEKHGMSLKHFLKAACMCYSLLIVSNLAGTMITAVIGALKGSPVINPVQELALNMDVSVLFLVTVIGAPVFEELFFRKFLIDRMVRYGELVSVVISGLMFGLFHGNLSQFPYAFTIGVFFGVIYVRTGRIIYPILLHAVMNFLGSIVGSILLNSIDLDMYMDVMNSTSINEILTNLTWEGVTGFLILAVYEVMIFIIVIIGIIFWILDWKQIFFKIQDEELPVSGRFTTALYNPGMIVYTVIWIITIIIASI